MSNNLEKARKIVEEYKCSHPNCNSCCCGFRGITGPTGPVGGILNFADFYALMPPDNGATVTPGTDVSFPQDGTTNT